MYSLQDNISRARNRWKKEAQTVASNVYGLTSDSENNKAHTKWFLEGYHWVYGLIKPATIGNEKEKCICPFGHTAISQVILATAFESKHGIAHLHPDKLQPVPLPMLAFAAVALKNALDEYTKTGIRINVDMDTKTKTQSYTTLLGSKLSQSFAIKDQGEHDFVMDDSESDSEKDNGDTPDCRGVKFARNSGSMLYDQSRAPGSQDRDYVGEDKSWMGVNDGDASSADQPEEDDE